MVTSGVIYHILRFLTIPVDIRNICVLLAPGFSGLTALAMYLLTCEMSPSPSAGLLAAAFMGIAPGYISRSVAGSYDNEAIAIFLLVFTFFLWIKAVKNGSISRYCFVDRPGFAWSDTAPSPLSAGMAIDAMSEALARADEQGPWVIAAAGIGSIYARIFSARTSLMTTEPAPILTLLPTLHIVVTPEQSSH